MEQGSFHFRCEVGRELLVEVVVVVVVVMGWVGGGVGWGGEGVGWGGGTEMASRSIADQSVWNRRGCEARRTTPRFIPVKDRIAGER